MSPTTFALCWLCEQVAAVYEVNNRPLCADCREKWAPGAKATPLPVRYTAPRLVTHDDLSALVGRAW
jgi:hypothetical protein